MQAGSVHRLLLISHRKIAGSSDDVDSRHITPGGEESESYIRYSFHSGFFVALSASFSLLDSLSLDPVFSTHLSYSEMDVLLYHAEVKLKYQLIEGVMWSTSVGVLFPKENNWHIGVMSQAAITF